MKKEINIAIFAPFKFDSLYQRPQALAEKMAEYSDINVYYFDFPQKNSSMNNNRLWFSYEHAVKKNNNSLHIIRVSNYFKFLGIPFRFSKEKMVKYTQKWLKIFFNKYLEGKEIIAFIETPFWWEYIKDFKFSKIFLDVIDDAEVLSQENTKAIYSNFMIKLAKKADKIFVTAERLEHELLKLRSSKDIIRIQNGVKIEGFNNAKNQEEIEKLRDKYLKIVGYIGVLNKWIDISLLEYIANAKPEYGFVFIGPYNKHLVANLKKISNIYLFGKRCHTEIPNFISSFDICLNPFLINNIGNNTNPIKLFEYIALGKPVISTEIYETKNFSNLIYVGKNYEDFLLKIDYCANQPEDPEIIYKRKDFARNNSWDMRVKDILKNMMDESAILVKRTLIQNN